MSNILSLRIAEDLGYSRPQTLLNNIYLDQLCYGAMAEWLRTITCDVDPVLGNNRLGVTRAYLEERGIKVLRQLARGLLEKEIPPQQLERQVSWMVDTLIEIQELWQPEQGLVACAKNGVSGFWRDYVKMSGHSSSIPSPHKEIGLCRYVLSDITVDMRQSHMAFIKRAQDALSIAKAEYAMPLSMDEVEKDLRKRKINTSVKASISIFHTDISQCEPHIRKFLLMAAWLMNDESLTWDQTKRWLMPS